jgi:hypothetical protein
MDNEKKTDSEANNPTATPLFSETDYETAWANAGPLARRRFAKKTQKVKYRAAYWQEDKNHPKGGYVTKKRLPPQDTAVYVMRWVSHFKNKGAANGQV